MLWQLGDEINDFLLRDERQLAQGLGLDIVTLLADDGGVDDPSDLEEVELFAKRYRRVVAKMTLAV